MARKTDPAYVTDLGSRLMKAKAEAKRLQLEWDSLFNGVDKDGAPESASSAITLVGRITTFLDSNCGSAYTAPQVSEALDLGQDKKQSLATTLSKLVKRHAIQKIGADQYTSKSSSAVGPRVENEEEIPVNP